MKGRKKGVKRTPGPYTVSRIRSELMGAILGMTRLNAKRALKRRGMTIHSIEDCVKLIKEKYKV